MIIMVVCTEGESSEPNYIRALKAILFGTSPIGYINTEIIEVPLGGNHGHRKIFNVADEKISEYANRGDNMLSIKGADDAVEKWLIVDYDRMEKHHITEEELRTLANEFDYRLVINRPNFELFVLCHFISIEDAARVPMDEIHEKINDMICQYNETHGYNKEENSALRLPPYSKNRFQSREFFGKLLDQNWDYADKFTKQNCYYDDKNYTEMWKIIDRIKELGSENNNQ